MRGNWYQISLIFLGVLVTALFGSFFVRELFPEYRTYQNIYEELEEFRSTYTGEPPPPFESGIKQILIERGGSLPIVDRCVSCHVALQFSHFSETSIAKDLNGNIIYDTNGVPSQVPNEDYIWKKLDEKIGYLIAQGKTKEADRFKSFKTIKVNENIYDVTKVLQAHPLIGRETRPFEYHPIDEYGCTVCHNGNGSGLMTDRAHGPVFDGQYEEQYRGPEPKFLEPDLENDPPFSRVFNHMPGHRLLFQTAPIFVGGLIEAKCIQCHRSSDAVLKGALDEANIAAKRKNNQFRAIEQGLKTINDALQSLVDLKQELQKTGYDKTVAGLRARAVDYSQSDEKMKQANANLDFVLRASGGPGHNHLEKVLQKVESEILGLIGSQTLATSLFETMEKEKGDLGAKILEFVEKNKENPAAQGALFEQFRAVQKDNKLREVVDAADRSIQDVLDNRNVLKSATSEMDILLSDFLRGEGLYLSQACYACHRIDGFARGGIGPELTNAGDSYPWYLKESIVWPQADLRTSKMPNFRLDHNEVENLVTFLLAQHGRGRAVSETGYRIEILNWEAGAKLPWEKPINPAKLHDLRFSMSVFASEGCAACHRLKGFESNVGFAAETNGKEKSNFDLIYKEREWFKNLIAENAIGSEIVHAIEAHQEDIDRRISDGVRKNAILEEIDSNHPHLIESFYSPFKYAARAKNAIYDKLATEAQDPLIREKVLSDKKKWEERVHRVLMIYIQEYGLGRLIGPRLNWSGIYRSDEWLIEHFRKPSGHTANSIMPVMPFDDSKFYALTYMLDILAEKNRAELREVWNHLGFNPEQAYHTLCSQCHGEFLHGNGPVAEWIYPIPKNLRNAEFLRNYTKENIISSIAHGVKGTPMPPWGEAADPKPIDSNEPVLSKNEIEKLVDWLFSSLLGGYVIRSGKDVPKWHYGPQDAIEEMKKEGHVLEPGPLPEVIDLKEREPDLGRALPSPDKILVSLSPHAAVKKTSDNHLGQIETKDSGISEYFNIYSNPFPEQDKNLYYIKNRYFTKENIKKGQEFFELNCAVCHGKEADGQGFRAGTMFDAKPRMLTNLHWIETRDDLRLLRSIKFGVPGTAMTPWGDLTTSLQRMQLVIFIRSLNQEQLQRDSLFNQIYLVFDETDRTLDAARIEQYKIVNNLQDTLNKVREKRSDLIQEVEAGKTQPDQAVSLFTEELNLSRKIKAHEEVDQLLKQLKELVKKEGHTYQMMGVTLIGKQIMSGIFDQYLTLVKINDGDYEIVNGSLQVSFDEEKEKEISKISKQLISELETAVLRTKKDKERIEAKLQSDSRTKELEEVNNNITGLQKTVRTLLQGLEETRNLREEQKAVYEKYQKKLNELTKV